MPNSRTHCNHCGEPLVQGPDYLKFYCDRLCKRRASEARKRERRRSVAIATFDKRCAHCGVALVLRARGPEPKYCGKPCREAGRERTRANVQAKARRERKRRATQLMCERCGVPFIRQSRRSARWCSVRCGKAAQWDRSPWRLRSHGVTNEEYDAWVSAREGRCDLCCGVPEYRLHIDHDHVTGRIRGLLCAGCNSALGRLGDQPEALYRAYLYLLGDVATQTMICAG